MLHTLPNEQQARRQGILLCTVALLSVLAMSHHPTGISSDANGGDFIHGVMLLLLFLVSVPLVVFSQRQGLGYPLVIAGLLAWMLALAGHLGAGVVNGFFVPALVQASLEDPQLLAYSWSLNQTLARLGVYASTLSALCWGVQLIVAGGRLPRTVGGVMLLAALCSIAILYTGHMTMDLAGARWLYGLQALWLFLLGGFMLLPKGENDGKI